MSAVVGMPAPSHVEDMAQLLEEKAALVRGGVEGVRLQTVVVVTLGRTDDGREWREVHFTGDLSGTQLVGALEIAKMRIAEGVPE